MHTTILTTIVLLLLPLLTAAGAPTGAPIWRPSVWPPVIELPYYWGDMLNITKCYCQSVNDNTHPANYYQFDYLNYHTAQTYTLAWTCDSDEFTTGWGTIASKKVSFPLRECWNAHDSWRKEKRRECVRYNTADVFCYELGNSHSPHDYYYFNDQKRGLPDYGIVEYAPDQCTDLCRDKVGGKAVASKFFSRSTPSVNGTLDFEPQGFSSERFQPLNLVRGLGDVC